MGGWGWEETRDGQPLAKNVLRPKPCTKCKQKLKMGRKYECKTQSHTIPAGNTGENTGDFESGKVFRGPIPHNLFTFKLTNQIFIRTSLQKILSKEEKDKKENTSALCI